MKRDINQLKQQRYDVIVIGAGVHGACVARDAALRGLSVALIDKGDLCGQTSHNSLKIIHGGIRYLQHLNLKRAWESIQEQRIWLTIAPHLVKPMPFLMPTYGHGIRGPEVMWLGIRAYETMGLGRNRRIPSHRQIPRGQVISRERCKQLVPGIPDAGLTGAAIWYDAQVFGADEAVIEFAASAAKHGAKVANYVCVQTILTEGNRVVGVRVKDELDQSSFDISGQSVVNAAGPWAKGLLSSLSGSDFKDFDLPVTRSMNIVTKPLFDGYAVGLLSKRQSDSVVGSTKRLYFFTPWKGCTIIGTTHFPYDDNPDTLTVSESEIKQFIDEINDVYPKANLTLADVHYCYKGLTPAEEPEENDPNRSEAKRSHHSKVIDHSNNGIDGLISIIGVKYTTARLVAETAVDLICRKLRRANVKCATRTQPLEGAQSETEAIEALEDDSFDQYCRAQMEQRMAVHLTDLVLRRMNLIMRGIMTTKQVMQCLAIMSEALAWTPEEEACELNELNKVWLAPELKQGLALAEINANQRCASASQG